LDTLITEIRIARKRLSEIHTLAQRTYLDSERKKLHEEEKELYARIDLAEREIRAKRDRAQEALPI